MTSSWAVRVYGTPVAQGSMKCVGGRGRHQLVDNKAKILRPWRDLVAKAGVDLMAHHQLDVITGPVEIEAVVTVGLPGSVKPDARPWPHLKAARTVDGGGDLDKLLRAIGDAWSGVVIRDDSQICHWDAWSVYPHSPHPLALKRPGAFIRITQL